MVQIHKKKNDGPRYVEKGKFKQRKKIKKIVRKDVTIHMQDN